MTREIGTTFSTAAATYEVVEDRENLNLRGSCTAPCAFNVFNKRKQIFDCKGLLSETGDCKRRWRDDKKSVYFKEVRKL